MDQDLWSKIGNQCLKIADEMIHKEHIPTAETAGVVKSLVETAAVIDTINLRWAEQSRFCGAVVRDRS